MANVPTFPKNGVFRIGTGLAGAPFLKVFLSTDVSTGIVAGTSSFSQAVNPPRSFMNTLNGHVYTTGLGTVEQLFSLTGAPPQHMMGATYVSQLAIALHGLWGTEGTAYYAIYNDTPNPETYVNQPVKVDWLLQD